MQTTINPKIKRMKLIKITLLSIAISTLTNCASGYKLIEPKSINYVSSNETGDVKLEYKYDLLDKKYAKKEFSKGVKLVALKITNDSDKDLTFGKDAKLAYKNGNDVYVMDTESVFSSLKQSAASYLWYLLLTPVNLYTTTTDSNGFQENTSSTPIGIVLGPGLAGGNMIAVGSANKKFSSELLSYNINGTLIKKGETKYGLIGIRTNSFESLKLNIE